MRGKGAKRLSLGPSPACKPKLQQAGAYYLVSFFYFSMVVKVVLLCNRAVSDIIIEWAEKKDLHRRTPAFGGIM